jgi:hypothetical protein
LRAIALAALLVASGCSPASTPAPARVSVSVHGGMDSDAFVLDSGDYDVHVEPPGQGCVYLLSLNGGSPNLIIPDADGNAAVLDNGAGSGYHVGPDPRDAACPATWSAVFTPAQ